MSCLVSLIYNVHHTSCLVNMNSILKILLEIPHMRKDQDNNAHFFRIYRPWLQNRQGSQYVEVLCFLVVCVSYILEICIYLMRFFNWINVRLKTRNKKNNVRCRTHWAFSEAICFSWDLSPCASDLSEPIYITGEREREIEIERERSFTIWPFWFFPM